MRRNICEICGEEFLCINRSKKTCSNACRQQAYRNRLNDPVHLSFTDEKIQSEYSESDLSDELFDNIIHIIIKRSISFCQDNSVHISDIQFVNDLIDSLEFYLEGIEKVNPELEYLKEFIQRLLETTTAYQDEYGYIVFGKKSTKGYIKHLTRILEGK